MKFLKHILTVATLFTIGSAYTARQGAVPRKAAPAKSAQTQTPKKAARKSVVTQRPIVQQPHVASSSYGQILTSLQSIMPTEADYTTLLNIRAEIDRQIAAIPQSVVRKIHNIDDTILDVMENAGGHAIARHVDQSQSDMALRLARENIEAASTFTNKATAVRAVRDNLNHNAEKIASWLETNPAPIARQAFYYTHAHPIGKSLVRGKENTLQTSIKSIVVLAADPTNDLGFRIVTAYPTHR